MGTQDTRSTELFRKAEEHYQNQCRMVAYKLKREARRYTDLIGAEAPVSVVIRTGGEHVSA